MMTAAAILTAIFGLLLFWKGAAGLISEIPKIRTPNDRQVAAAGIGMFLMILCVSACLIFASAMIAS